jgi:hypothetical protein
MSTVKRPNWLEERCILTNDKTCTFSRSRRKMTYAEKKAGKTCNA